MREPELRIIPLGGLEEIGGLNMTVMSLGDDIIIIDAGLMFPEDDMLGIDLVIPDFSFLRENVSRIRAILLTHGHEDHVGALPFLLKDINVPVYGTALTLGLVMHKLAEHGLEDSTELVQVRPRQKVQIGGFEIEFLRVTHSIVDGVALAISTPVGNIIHTGDFKIDPTPVDGELLDFHKFTEYGEKGTLVLLSDSTNAEHVGYTFSEKEVRRGLEDVFRKAEGRIIISTFSSNIHRIQQALDVSRQFGRKVVICGRSLVSNTEIAMDLGYLSMPPDTWHTLESMKDLDDHEIVILTTGSQGEPMSVLSRIAVGEHKQIKIKEGDTVVLSAKTIPGNERSIGRIINRFSRQGATVIHEKVSEIHVSGHASREELKLMINMVRPKYFVPIHGEHRHLDSHARIANRLGIERDNIFVMVNGDVLKINPHNAFLDGKVNTGRVFIDGKGVGEVEAMVLRDRKRLGYGGLVIVMLTVGKEFGKLVAEPDIITRGFIQEEEYNEVISDLKSLVKQTIEELDHEVTSDSTLLKAKVRSVLKKHFRVKMDRHPMIMPLVFEV